MSRVAVTGANGFVGSALVETLVRGGVQARGLVRSASQRGQVTIGDIHGQTDWGAALQGVDVVIHCAARVHVMVESEREPIAAFRRINTDGSRRLAEEAARMGVQRIVYVSSIKVYGETTPMTPRGPEHFRFDDAPSPVDPYGVSKWEAEQAIMEVADRTGLEFVIVRPPLVYGPGVGGNFARLVQLVRRGVPIPFGRVRNYRSLVARQNLVDLLAKCASHPCAPGRVFLVSDDEDVSTPDLVRRIASAMGQPSRLIPVPVWFLRTIGRLTGRSAEVERLLDSLTVDIQATRDILGWDPPVTLDEGIRVAVGALAVAGN